MNEQEKNSVVDDLYFHLYGEHQTKEGQALERLSAVAFKLLEEARKVQYDQQVRAPYSNTVYQVDSMIGEAQDQVMVEAKDYTVQGKKVGRADLQKLEGALTDLDIAEGRFVSATDYTNRAKPYAESTKTTPKQNPIELYHVRPSTEEDEQGRIKHIQVTIQANGLSFEKGHYKPLFNKAAFENIKSNKPKEGQQIAMTLYQFYGQDGTVIETMENITRQLNYRLPVDAGKGYVLEGKWDFSDDTFMDVPTFGRLQVDSLEYKIPTYHDVCVFTIDQKGKPVLLIKSEDGTINKLFTDEQLKQFKFEGGEVMRK